MWTWYHQTGYPEDHYIEHGLSTEEILDRLKKQSSFYWEYDKIELDNPNPSFEPWEFRDKFSPG